MCMLRDFTVLSDGAHEVSRRRQMMDGPNDFFLRLNAWHQSIPSLRFLKQTVFEILPFYS